VKPLPGRKKQPNPNWPEQWKPLPGRKKQPNPNWPEQWKFSEQKQKKNESGVGGCAAGQAAKPLPGREKQPNSNQSKQWKSLPGEVSLPAQLPSRRPHFHSSFISARRISTVCSGLDSAVFHVLGEVSTVCITYIYIYIYIYIYT
jgi:hypothetical protein